MSSAEVPPRRGLIAFAQTIEGDLLGGTAKATPAEDAPPSNMALIMRLMAAISANDAEAITACLDPDMTVTIHTSIDFGLILKSRGAADTLSLILHNFALLHDQQPELHCILDQGDAIHALLRERGTVAATGQPYDVNAAQHYRFSNGRIASLVQIMAPHTD